MSSEGNFIADIYHDLQLSIVNGSVWWIVGLSVFILLIAVIGGVWWLRRRSPNRRSALFHELCMAHHLTLRQRNLLRRLAGLRRLEDPLVLMVDATRWHLEQLEKESQLRKQDLQELKKLQSTLYVAPRLDTPNTLSDSGRVTN
jgi:hypothetical protein